MNEKILALADDICKEDGLYKTHLDDVDIYKNSTSSPRAPLLYDLCLIIVFSGEKIGYLEEHKFIYNSKNYLAVPATMPFECATTASKEIPFRCMVVKINKDMMFDIISSLDFTCKDSQEDLVIFSDEVKPEIENVVERLLKALTSKVESSILGESLLKELYYHIATGKNAAFLHKMFLNTNNEAKISTALKSIHQNYDKHLDIPTLAKIEDMSVASFHTHFKKITALTPLQYIKRLRLNKAKELITRYNYQVSDSANAVGYESNSQFSRDFKSFFGIPPKEARASFEVFASV